MSKKVREDYRFKASCLNLVTVTVSRKTDTDGAELPGVLMDLSRGGLRLKVDECLLQGTEIQLALSAPKAGVEIHSAAKVRWVEPNFRAGWIVGCSLDDPIEEDLVSDLANCGALERRTDSRRPISFMAEAKTELERDYNPVQILNLSAGGFCATGEGISVKLDDRLLLRISDANHTAAKLVKSRIAWVNDSDEGQTFGCAFLTKCGRSQMQAMVSADESGNPLFDTVNQQATTRWVLVATVLAFIVLVQYLNF